MENKKKIKLYHTLIIVATGLLWFVPHIWPNPEFIADDFYNLFLLGTHGVILPWSGVEHLNWMAMRPLASASMYLDIILYGTNASGYYVTNITIHFLCAVVFYNLLNRAQMSVRGEVNPTVSLVFSLVLLVHSDIFYSTLMISNRTESISLLFNLLFCGFALRCLRNPTTSATFAMLILLVLSLLAKAHAVSLPFVFFALSGLMKQIHRTNITWRRTLMVFLILFIPVISYYAVWMVYDDMSKWTLEMVVTKAYSIFALILLMIHPELVYQGYGYLYEYKIVLLIVIIILVAFTIWTVLRLSSQSRPVVVWSAVIMGSILLPRMIHLVSDRVNSFPQAVALGLVALLMLKWSPRMAYIIGLLLLTSHFISSNIYINEWKQHTSNEKYRNLLEAKNGIHNNKSVILLNGSLFEPYALHYHMHGTFGLDSTLKYSSLMLIRKPFTRSTDDYTVTKTDSGFIFNSRHPRIGFHNEHRLRNTAALEIRTLEPLHGYGFRSAEVMVSHDDDRSLFIDSCRTYIRLQ